MKTFNHRFSCFLLGNLIAFSLIGQMGRMPVFAEETEFETEAAVQTEEPAPTPDPHRSTYYDEPQSNSYTDWPAGPLIESEAAIVMDLDTDAVLYAKNINQKCYPASITKLMTGLLACENLDLSGNFEMSESAAYGIEPGSPSIYADTGEKFTMEQGLMALMLESANEMALRFGELVSGSEKKFVELMNQRARQLTCTRTHFNNPHGLPDDNHYTTARDMAKIAQAAWQNQSFRFFFTTDYYEIPPTNVMKETRYMLNNHHMMAGQTYAYDGVLGGKTGYTDVAGHTLVTFARKNRMNLVVVVLSSVNGGFPDTAALLDYAFDHFEHLNMHVDLNPVPELLPAQKELVKTGPEGCIFPYRKSVTVTVPTGTNREDITREASLLENTAGPYRIKSKYYFHDHQVGFGMQYETQVFRNIIAADQ